MRYVTRVLQPGETVVYSTKLHWFVYLWALLLLAICVALAIAASSMPDNPNISLALWIAAAIFGLLALSSALRALIRRATTELAVTDQRVIYKTGLLARHTLEMNRARVESVTVDHEQMRGREGEREGETTTMSLLPSPPFPYSVGSEAVPVRFVFFAQFCKLGKGATSSSL